MKKISEMKKMTMICMAALLVTAMSCKKEKVENTAVGVGFRATLEAHAGDSKTHLDGLSVKWDANDAVKVVNANDVAKTFVISAIHDDYSDLVPAEGEGVTDDFYKPNYQAYYPADIYDEGQVSLPQTQDYAAGSFGKGFNPMAAYAVNKNLDFKNLCGLLALQLTGDCKVKSITITSKKDEMLWGKGELTLNSSKVELGALTDGGNSITLNCYVNNEYVQLSGTAKTFYFVVPAGTLSKGFDVVLTDNTGKVWKKSTSADLTIQQSHIKPMQQQNVVTKAEGALSGLFSVANDKQVYFSQGNLQYVGSTQKWQFAASQYEFIGATLGQNTNSSTATRDLFGWGDLTGYNTSSNSNDYSWSQDWGTKIGTGWRTLTGNYESGEWDYLINKRNNHSNLCGEGTVNGVKGLIILPDSWEKPSSVSFVADDDYNDNVYDLTQWSLMESAGAVFLPAAGRREGTDIMDSDRGFYWSSTHSQEYFAHHFHFQNGYIYPHDLSSHFTNWTGMSVRLVRDAN